MLHISLKEHPEFTLERNNIYSSIELSMLDAILGCEVLLKTIYGEKKIKLPPGLYNDQKLYLRGLGAPLFNDKTEDEE